MSTTVITQLRTAEPRLYRMLRIHIFLLTLVGWGAIAGAGLYLATLFTADSRTLVSEGLIVAGAFITGLCLLAFAEFLQLAIHVEENTRDTA